MKRYALIAILLLGFILPARADAATVTPVYLVGPGGNGGTIGTGTGVTQTGYKPVGDSFRVQQSFRVYSGTLSSVRVRMYYNYGSPTMNVLMEILNDAGDLPNQVIWSQEFFPSTGVNIVVPTTPLYLDGSQVYWLRMSTITQWYNQQFWFSTVTGNLYPDGVLQYITDNYYQTWGFDPGTDLIFSVITGAGQLPSAERRTKLAESFSVGETTTISSLSLYMLKVGTPGGTLSLDVQTDAGNAPSGFNIATGATASESDLTTAYSYLQFTFPTPIKFSPGNRYWLVLSTDRTDPTNYVGLGTVPVCDISELKSLINQHWQPELSTGLFTVTVDSISTSGASTSKLITLASGQEATIDYTVTAGDSAISMLLMIGIGLLIVCLFMSMLIAKRLKPS